jgi:hypothetical protein
MQTLILLDTEDLNEYWNKLENYNLQLSWVGQEMSPSFLIHLAQMQPSKSHYAKDIESLQFSSTTSGTSFTVLNDLISGLKPLDELRGLPFRCSAIIKPPPKPSSKKVTNIGMVAAVQDDDIPDAHL